MSFQTAVKDVYSFLCFQNVGGNATVCCPNLANIPPCGMLARFGHMLYLRKFFVRNSQIDDIGRLRFSPVLYHACMAHPHTHAGSPVIWATNHAWATDKWATNRATANWATHFGQLTTGRQKYNWTTTMEVWTINDCRAEDRDRLISLIKQTYLTVHSNATKLPV